MTAENNNMQLFNIYSKLSNRVTVRVTTKEYNDFMMSDYVMDDGGLRYKGDVYRIVGKKIAPGVYSLSTTELKFT